MKSLLSLKPCPSRNVLKRLSLKKLIQRLRELFTIQESRTAFVDAEFGNDLTAKLNSPAHSFKTIQAAITAITIKDPIRIDPWQILISPGSYTNQIMIPSGINLIGSGNATILSQLAINGASEISNLLLIGPNLPVIDVSFNGVDVNGPVKLTNVNIDLVTSSTGQPVISLLQPSGIDGSVEFLNSKIQVDFTGVKSSEATNVVIFSNMVRVGIIDSIFNVAVSYEPSTILIRDTDNQLTVQGGSSMIRIEHRSPEKNVIFFDAPGGFLLIQGHSSVALETLGGQPQKDDKLAKLEGLNTIQALVPKGPNDTGGNVILANAAKAGLIKISDTIVDFSSVPRFTQVLANVVDRSARVSVFNVKTYFSRVFPVTGILSNISYLAVSEQANIVSNGGLYTNIITVNATNVGGDLYPVQDNDYTVLVTDPPVNVGLADPTIASESVIFKGKIVVVKNISTTVMQVVAQNDTLFDGTQTLLPGKSRQFQNDGIKWYVI